MSEAKNDNQNSPEEARAEAQDEQSTSLTSRAADLAELGLTGVPAPVRRSLTKVLARLTTAAFEYPVTLLENAIEERKAESRARVNLIEVSMTQIAEQMQVPPEYGQAATEKFAQRVIRERVNVDKIASLAVKELAKLPSPEKGTAAVQEAERPDVDEDWLNAFEGEASRVSTEHAQKVFAKILAGEINSPASFSKKTLRLIAQLDNNAAHLFSLACSMSVSLKVGPRLFDARVPGMGQIGQNSLAPYGLSYNACVTLQEYGLVVSDLSGSGDYQGALSIDGVCPLPLCHQDESWALVKPAGQHRVETRIEGLKFTTSGGELLGIVEKIPVPQYTEALKKHLGNTFGVEMAKIVHTVQSASGG